MRSPIATHNLLAVSANSQETAINTEQTLDATMLVPLGTIINMPPRREHNADDANGKEEADILYNLGYLSDVAIAFERAQPQHFAFLYAYALGSVSTAAAGAGYEHTITPISNDLDEYRSNPTFTAAQRLGSTIFKRLFGSMAVDSVSAVFSRDAWAKISGQIKGTGKYTNNITEETVSANGNATSLILAANAVEGATAAARLDNVQRIRVNLSGSVWTDVTYTAVSAATPAVITIVSPGGAATPFNYEILYVPTEAAWATFPAEVTETPLRVTGLTLTLGGAWNGSAFQGGRDLDVELNSIEHSFNNNLRVEYIPGGNEAYAGAIIRDGRDQALKLDREMREFILQQHLLDNDTFGVYILCQGAIFDGAHRYQVEIIFPKCGVMAAPISVNGKRLAEAGDLKVLEDDTYGSVIVKVKNLQATYAA